MDTGADQCTVGGDAWIKLHDTGEKIKCNGFYQGKNSSDGPTVPVMSLVTCMEAKGEEPILLLFHQTCYIDEKEQQESLCHPYQCMDHGVKFDLTPMEHQDDNGNNGRQIMKIEDREIPLEYDGRKTYVKIRRPTEEELDTLEVLEMTSPDPYEPEGDVGNKIARNRKTKAKECPGGWNLEKWQDNLGLAPDDVIRKTFDATTQLAMNVEIENRTIGRKHYKSRFPFLREKRLNDEFHTDTYFPSEKTSDGKTCSQMFIGRNTDFMKIYLMKTESHCGEALQDFGREIGVPRAIKTDNARAETGYDWTKWCRTYRVKSSTTEPHSPWQNKSERGIADLSRMVKRTMKKFDVPLSRHGWCQLHCANIRNHLASRKLGWKTPTEKLLGDTPDISKFRFHFWEPIEYWEPAKQPDSGWKKGRFLGIDESSGDDMTFFIETEKDSGEGKNVILTRSNVRTRYMNEVLPSGETESESSQKDVNFSTIKDNEEESISVSTRENIFKDDEEESLKIPLRDNVTNTKDSNDSMSQNDNKISKGQSHSVNDICHDDAVNDNNEKDDIKENDDAMIEDDANIYEEVTNIMNDDEEDHEFNKIINHKWDAGLLVLEVELQSGTTYEVPFNVIKKDRPIEVARYIRNNVIESRRGGKYNTWAKKILVRSQRTIRRLKNIHNVSKITRLLNKYEIKIRRISRNKRNEKKGARTKYGIEIPRNVKEALIMDERNGNTLWADAIMKEMSALEKAKVWSFYPPHHKLPPDYQYAPLQMIFDVKQEDLRRKARLVAGGHVVESSMWESYSSVVQQRSIRLLETIALNEGLSFVTGDIGNAFVQADTKEKIYTIAGKEFGNKKDCVVVIKKALYGLATSARQWNIKLGDSIRKLGFHPTRADPDLWIKENKEHNKYEYIATYVDDLIVVAIDPMQYIDKIKNEYPIRNIEMNPEYYLGNNIEVRTNNTIKISSAKYINEVIRKYESEHGTLKKENVPAKPDDHPETDTTPFLDKTGITKFQSVIGTCQWICTSGRFDINFAVTNLSRFCASPREGHLKRAEKILGYLKKYTKRGYVVDPRDPIVNLEYKQVIPDFGNQYSDFSEDEDTRLPKPLMKELAVNIFVDSNHAHDRITGRSITGMICFVGRTPITNVSKRQSSVQTTTFGAEFVALKKAVEEAITTRYYLRSMGVAITKPVIIYGDNLSAITNTITPGSALSKKYLALSYHFCREYYSANIVDIRKIDTKENYADPFTKALVSNEFHGFMGEIMEN